MKRKALSLLLCMTMILTMMPISALADTKKEISAGGTVQDQIKTESGGEPILAYVPLDNRSVNVDRVIYEAGSAGFKVVMPDEDLYTTRLDGQPLNSNGTQYGDSDKLLDWILEQDKATDYFVISLDQILSGGLVNARTISNTDYAKEHKIIDAIIELSKNNHVYIIDTVTRLASCTVGYKGATLETYNYLRQYNLNARRLLGDESLTIKNIVEGYTEDQVGRKIFVDRKYAKEVSNSLDIRERKLRMIDYILTKDLSGKIKYFIGIDDSNPQNTIQTNEINYIKIKMGDRGSIYSGTDELGMMAVMNLMIDHYGYHVNAAAVYFGDTETSSSGSIYDLETVRENVEEHLKSLGVKSVSKEKADLEIVILTLPARSIMNSKYINRMIDYINENISQGIPTIVINSAPSAYSGNFEYRMVRECEMGMLLSYSSWGTVGNSIGLALSNGISRYLYLHSRDNSSDTADIAFLKGLIFSYEKDISYLRSGGKNLFNNYLASNGWAASNFYKDDKQVKKINQDLENILKTSEYNVTVNDIIDNLTDCRYLKGLKGECGIIGSIRLSNYSAPFFRVNEIRFDIDADLSNVTINGFKDDMTVNMPYTPAKGRLTYSLTLYYRDKAGRLYEVPCTYDRASGNVKFTTDSLSGFFIDALSMDEDKAYSLFTDVSDSSWYFNYVMYAYEKGLMRGTTGKTFEPEVPMTRAMLVYTLYRMAGIPESAYKNEMPHDVGNNWYKGAVEWALANEIVSGYGNGNFGPDDFVTREQLAGILWRYAKYKGMDVSKGDYPELYDYKDAAFVSQDLRDGFDWACSTGIITGKGNGKAIMPKEFATRAEVAAVLKRFVEK